MSTTFPTNTRVYVIDDDQAVRESLKWLLESVSLVAKTYPSAQDFLDDFDAQPGGCIITDVRMPGMSGLDLHDTLRKRGVQIPTLVITGHADVPMAVRALKGGVFDFIEKPFNDQDLLDRVSRAVTHGGEQLDDADWRTAVKRCYERLTPREQEVFALVVQGRSNKLVGAELGVSEKTVEIHRGNVMRKMDCTSLAALVRKAVLLEEEGIVTKPANSSLS